MTILAIEFSSERRSVAVAADGNILGKAEETGGRTARVFALIERAMVQAQIERERIDSIAIGLGPGSYAGIRSAIALAQGWRVARPIALLGVSSVESIALQAQSESMFGQVSILIDAQRNEFYFAAYEISPSHVKLIEPLRLLDRESTLERCKTGAVIVSPALANQFPQGRVLLPESVALAALAEKRRDLISGNELEPIYLRETSFVKSPPPRQIHSLS